ncbi:MAG: LacI family DNA-binding transcriptional regulator [Actinomycetaceae bacterium]|nr:LacI family DNA-binding transcriptional regulator [Actinomycetaceae bacterium]
MSTVVDVARSAGVSTATVSRVLNNQGVRPETVQRVEKAMKELGYIPNRTARSLRTRRSELIALVVPDIENPFFTALARGVEDIAQQAGYSVVLCNSDDDEAKESRYLRVAASESMAGVILAPAGQTPDVEALKASGSHLVVVDRHVDLPVDQVVFDNVLLGKSGTDWLLEQGCKRIACVTGPSSIATAVDRATGWRQAYEQCGLSAPEDLLAYTNFRVEAGEEVAARLFSNIISEGELGRTLAPEVISGSKKPPRKNPMTNEGSAGNPGLPDAILAANNLVGLGVLRALSQLDRKDIRVAVIGTMPFASEPRPDVFSIPLPMREMGIRAATLLLKRITGQRQDSGVHHILNGENPIAQGSRSHLDAN